MNLLRQKKPAPAGVRRPPGLSPEQSPAKGSLARAGGSLLLGHTILNLLLIYLARVWPGLADLLSGPDFQHYIWGLMLVQGLLVLLPAVGTIFIFRIPAPVLIGRKAATGSLFLAIATGVSAAVVLQGLNNLLVYFLVRAGVSFEAASSPLFADPELLKKPWQMLLVLLVAVAVLPAIIEELFFRGVLFAALSARGVAASAIIWQAIAFSFYHTDPFFLLPPLLAGLILAYIRHHCGRLWPAIIAHLALNLASLALAPLLPSLTQTLLKDNLRQATSLFYASLIAAAIAAVVLIPVLVVLGSASHKKSRPGQGQKLYPGDWRFTLAIILQIVTIILSRKLA